MECSRLYLAVYVYVVAVAGDADEIALRARSGLKMARQTGVQLHCAHCFNWRKGKLQKAAFSDSLGATRSRRYTSGTSPNARRRRPNRGGVATNSTIDVNPSFIRAGCVVCAVHCVSAYPIVSSAASLRLR